MLTTLPADAATVDLAEADRIVGGGAGLDGAGALHRVLAEIGALLGASVGAARVITDRGWIGHDRQIGTTGGRRRSAAVRARSASAGPCSTTSGLGASRRTSISVNTDAHCPMMQLADLAVTADANATLDELLIAHLAAQAVRCRTTNRSRPSMPEPASLANDADVIVVGGGPAGACAALVAARAGLRTVLVERGPFPGSKNMYGGVIYPRILDALIPQWWETAPVQRWITRRSTMILSDERAVTVDYRTEAWGRPPYSNGATAYRPDFDHWLVEHAVAAGAQLVCGTTVTGLLRSGGRVVGVRTDRPDGELRAPVVIACDGVNSFLAKQAGMAEASDAAHYTLGVKETLALPKDVIDERFGVRDRHGVDIEVVGCTSGVNGGGFIYTNLDTVAVGVVLKLPKLATQSLRPEEIIARMKRHPAIAAFVDGADLKEYSAHLIPEGGVAMMPRMTMDGMLVAGDAAALCLAAGIWLEGVNFAMASGMYAAEAAVEALRAGDVSAAGLAGYERRLRSTFVLRDHHRLRRAPELVLSDREQHLYPKMVTGVVERMFRSTTPRPSRGCTRSCATSAITPASAGGTCCRDSIAVARTFL